jgi:hypothetical protein
MSHSLKSSKADSISNSNLTSNSNSNNNYRYIGVDVAKESGDGILIKVKIGILSPDYSESKNRHTVPGLFLGNMCISELCSRFSDLIEETHCFVDGGSIALYLSKKAEL